ncbi:hypothetical protein VFPFJ_01754 [Purpureocillium lilacinum]|uniref:Uncharacterized protein n=1 Tax=Purpureocillium lilacinum TaxID=33203 RepID=A0A179G140_PURLI|nr:hypothetical protein VFPFJ_01754 [Purpureocillium lilacinum]OAQ71542.1 hypothetical protein VFPBJ_10321 [Purpureocillium lilacinum]OAQ92593.1 hypothetical protein VFPFJ_01754 [Purpureocillium lilacinum]
MSWSFWERRAPTLRPQHGRRQRGARPPDSHMPRESIATRCVTPLSLAFSPSLCLSRCSGLCQWPQGLLPRACLSFPTLHTTQGARRKAHRHKSSPR